MSFSENRPALKLQDIELLMQIVSRAQLMLPILSEAIQRFADGIGSPTYYWDPMRHWASVQQLIDASIRIVGLRDLEKIGEFSATMDLWETLNELGAVLYMVIGVQKTESSQLLLDRQYDRLEKTISETLVMLTRERILWAWNASQDDDLSPAAVEWSRSIPF
jgi:hypothetical protein